MSEFFVMDGSVRYVFAPPPDRSKVCCTASTSSSRGPDRPSLRAVDAPHRAYHKAPLRMHHAESDGAACE